MNCHLCNDTFLNPNIFLSHLKYNHGISDNFKCFDGNCFRVFNRSDAYKRHILLNHLKGDSLGDSHNSCILSSDTSVNAHLNEATINLSTNSSTHDTLQKDQILGTSKDNTTHFLNLFSNLLESAVNKFISTLYNLLTLNRSVIQEIVTAVSNLLSSGIITEIKNSLLNGNIKECNEMLNIMEYPFKHLDTEYKRTQYFEKCNYLIKPIPFSIGTVEDPMRKDGNTSLILKQRLGYFVSMKLQLKSFLEIPGVYKVMCDYREKLLHHCDSEYITNIMQADIWKEYLNISKNKNVFPIIVYFDDFETNNPLGSHAGVCKQGGVYFSILSIPSEYSSRLENIFLAMLFRSSDRIKFGNKAIFDILVNELIFLENTGINVIVDGNQELVYFSAVVFAGDNLGIHSLYGLTESFSANHYCRFCKDHKQNMQMACTENEELLRQVDEYDTMVLDKSYGIKEECVFHKLPNFHIYKNLSCDIMHDLSEGVHRYSMAKIIQHFISHEHFSLDHLNERIKYFNYGYMERNTPPPIKQIHLTNGCIIMSSAEMMCLVLNFRFIVGDLIPEDNSVWNFYLTLLEVTEIVMSTSISNALIDLLKTLVEELNYLYINIFNESLKPKFHFLLHYPRIMKKVGPLCNIQSIRFEAKHKDFKTNAHVVSSRKNISYTLSFRIQLKLCHRFLSQKGLNDITSFGPLYELPKENLQIRKCDHFFSINSYCLTWYENNGIRYNDQSILIYDISDNFPQFCKIDYIVVSDDKIFFVTTIFHTRCFNLHFRSYEIEYIKSDLKVFNFVLFKNNSPGVICTAPSGEKYVSISKL